MRQSKDKNKDKKTIKEDSGKKKNRSRTREVREKTSKSGKNNDRREVTDVK